MTLSIVAKERHVCQYCGSGHLIVATTHNPVRTDWCMLCGRKLEGIKRQVTERKELFVYLESQYKPSEQPES